MSANQIDDGHLNILLLGETGVGKSTFINSLANYLYFDKLEDANDGELICLIPCKFTVADEEGDPMVLHFGEDANEDSKLGNSSTLTAKSYVFPLGDRRIRLIDTPGVNDTRGGVMQDRENFQNMLEYIGQFKYLHSVCVLLKPDQTSLTPSFKYCFTELMSRLNRSAVDNITFVFTRTRSTDYMALETVYCLQQVLQAIEQQRGVHIPLRRNKKDATRNCFYVDNECFNYLVAQKHSKEIFSAARAADSWGVSQAAVRALIGYINGEKEGTVAIRPHLVEDTMSVNDARQLIYELSKPLADLTENVQDNLTVLKQHQAKVAQANISAEELRLLLHVPVVDLKETQLSQPVTVCTSRKCSEIYTVCGMPKYHFKQRCHEPCYLSQVPKNTVGDPGLMHCDAMQGTADCKQCGCGFSIHMHVYYETEAVETRIEDKTVQVQLQTNDDIIKTQYNAIQELEKRVREYKREHDAVTNALAIFAHFLNKHSIVPINDAYETYLDTLIQREQIAFNSDKSLLKRYEALKREHLEQKAMLENADKIDMQQTISQITSAQIAETVEKLKQLPLIGSKIKSLHILLINTKRIEELRDKEYVHSTKIKNNGGFMSPI